MLTTHNAVWLLWGIAQATCIGVCGGLLLLFPKQFTPAHFARVALVTLLLMGMLPALLLLPIDDQIVPTGSSSRTVASRPDETAPEHSALDVFPIDVNVHISQALFGLFDEPLQLNTKLVPPHASGNSIERKSRNTVGWFIYSMMFGSLLGCARLAIGWWQVRRLIGKARPVPDSSVQGVIEQLARRANSSSRVQVRESSQLASPAVVGWLRPVIGLPVEWRDWDEGQLRSVLAHELAHLQRRDTLSNVAAQSVLALYYFHPLAHWVVARLRMSQELAADALAAPWAGGNEEYSHHLARLALRSASRRTSPVLAFLPSRHTLVRRLEMLARISPHSQLGRRSHSRSFAILGLLCGVAMGVALIRPVVAQRPAAQPTTAPTTEAVETEVVDDLLAYVSDESTALVVDIRVPDLVKTESLKKALAEIPISKQGLPVAMEDIERVLILVPPPSSGRSPVGLVRLLPAIKPPAGNSLPMLDSRTLVLGSKELDILRGAINDGQGRKLAQSIQHHPAQGMRVAWLSQPFQHIEVIDELLPLTPLWSSADTGSLGLTLDDKLKLELRLDTEAPQRIADTLKAVVTLARNGLEAIATQGGTDDQSRSPVESFAKSLQPFQPVLTELLDSAQIEIGDRTVTALAQASDAAALALEIALPAARAARIATAREQARENMLQIGLALHNYHEQHGHLPSSVIEENGVKRSWRVEILPYLNQQALYNAYRKDEPWDSPANLQWANVIIPIYQPIGQTPTTKTPYRAIAGEHGALGVIADGQGPAFADITDGSANTIAFVETSHLVPWSSPDEFAPVPADLIAQPARDQGFLVGMADGSVHFISSFVDPTVLAALLTRDGGEKPIQ